MPKTLLLADDSVTIQKVVGISFANEDITLVTVNNGDDAIARAREVRPDIVLADVVMPGKSGYEVCEAVKSDPALGHIPVLLLTGTFEPFDEQRARRVRADGHITKPFEAQALVDEVNALLAARRAPSAAATPAAKPEPVVAPPADEAYDFFDQELTDPGTDRGALEATLVEDDLDVEASSEPEGIAFAAPPRSAVPHRALSEGPGDHTIAIFADAAAPSARGPETREFATTRILDDLDTAPGYTPRRTPTPPVREATVPQPPLVDPLADVEPGDLSDAAVLDPAAGRAFDVSSSDLGSPEQVGRHDLVSMSAAPAPRSSGRDASTPLSRADFAPMLRERVHETLEKMAWEAFGQVTETIVKEALERVEKVAWEVIPRMAETLIQEEIRRLKSESSED
jgi:CheY-like chemotaxis protein